MTFINSLDSSSNKITLTKYDPPAPELLITDQECTMIAFLDTETTGVDRMNDQIIELAIKVVEFESTRARSFQFTIRMNHSMIPVRISVMRSSD